MTIFPGFWTLNLGQINTIIHLHRDNYPYVHHYSDSPRTFLQIVSVIKYSGPNDECFLDLGIWAFTVYRTVRGRNCTRNNAGVINSSNNLTLIWPRFWVWKPKNAGKIHQKIYRMIPKWPMVIKGTPRTVYGALHSRWHQKTLALLKCTLEILRSTYN